MSPTIKEALDEMYQLGYKHGYEAAKRHIEIENLKKALKEAEGEQ